MNNDNNNYDNNNDLEVEFQDFEEAVDNETDNSQPQESDTENTQPLEPDTVYSADPFFAQQTSYSDAQNTAYTQNTVYTVPPQTSKKKGAKKKGIKIFFFILALIVIIAIGITGYMLATKDENSGTGIGTSDTDNVTGDAALNISDTPDTQNVSEKGVLTATQIYEKVQSSNVGIVVYSQHSSAASGEGSGIIMGEDSSGKHTYIITCAHVISGSGVKAVVQLHDGTQYDAEIVGYDVRTDIGVLKIKATGLTAAEFGDSNKLKVGETVYALGNPGGMEFFGSFTHGMVSAISRPVSSEIGYSMECLQHSAAISPGNSGGALINSYGPVIGINSLKITDSDYELMGFAIPISSAKEIIDNLIAYGRVPNRPKLGISYYSNSSSQQYNMIVQIKGLPAGSLIIADINPDSDLANTEAQVGDLIIAVNGKDLTTADVLLEMIDNGKVGDTLTLTLCRISNNYKISEFKVKVKLVEDSGTVSSSVEETTGFEQYINPFGN